MTAVRLRYRHRRRDGRITKARPDTQTVSRARYGSCDWHRGDIPVDYTYGPESCEDCGNLLMDKKCRRCGRCFLDFSASGYDDVVSAPRFCEVCDLTCARCLPIYHDHEEEDDWRDELGEEWEDEEDDFYAELEAETEESTP